MNTHEPNHRLKNWNITNTVMFLPACLSHILSVCLLPKVNMIFNFMFIILKIFKQFISCVYYMLPTIHTVLIFVFDIYKTTFILDVVF